MIFKGFVLPESNYSKLPHALVGALPIFTSLAELKVVLYILRHTWGYQEYDKPKRITLDEFVNGRKKRDGTRMDSGVGMSENAVMEGLARAEEHGFLTRVPERRDRPGRPAFSYSLKYSSEVEVYSQNKPQKLRIQSSEVEDSSEKDTIDKKHDDSGDFTESEQKAIDALKAFEVNGAKDLVKMLDPAMIMGWLAYADEKGLGPGFVAQRIREGEEPPQEYRLSKEERERRHRERYITGKYAHLIEH